MVDGMDGGQTPSLTNPDLGTGPAMANNPHVDASTIRAATAWTLRPRRAPHQRSTAPGAVPPPASVMTCPPRLLTTSHCPIPTQCRILPRTVAPPQSDSDHQGSGPKPRGAGISRLRTAAWPAMWGRSRTTRSTPAGSSTRYGRYRHPLLWGLIGLAGNNYGYVYVGIRQ
jgi:hypothetical protein